MTVPRFLHSETHDRDSRRGWYNPREFDDRRPNVPRPSRTGSPSECPLQEMVLLPTCHANENFQLSSLARGVHGNLE